jgi:aminoglycoside phosphotransferase (APT) family kinase protein
VDELNEFLYRTRLAKSGDEILWTPLAGGVSSDIWRVDLPDRIVCVKRALARLKVHADWTAPVERNIYEWEWFKFVDENFPGMVPRPVAHDAEMRMLAMEYLPPEDYIVWKAELLSGTADAEFAAQVGKALGQIHAKSADDEKLNEIFATDKLFFALRIEPYLLATAEKHPDIALQIKEIADSTLAAKIALVHGDVSPKNILKGKNGPVFLDAETAWYGDPAFDLAFCLNHFLLKSTHNPKLKSEFLLCFQKFYEHYLGEVNWELTDELEQRTARLLPILILARVDGKSPVEYITDEKVKEKIRIAARDLFAETGDLRSITERWRSFVKN